MKQVIIIRGLPGTGTFELGEQLQRTLTNAPHWSPEKYFDKPGDYEPNPRLYHPLLVPAAERWCFEMVYQCLTSYPTSTVIVSDVFLTRDSVSKYTQLAAENEATCVILEAAGKSPTDVPAAVMYDLRNMWEPL